MEELLSDGLRLSAHFARPNGAARVPALLVLPGFPRGPGGAATVGNTDKTLCDRVARDAGWAGLTFNFRGTGPSEGDFSIEGWLADVRAAVDALLARADITGVWIAGFRLGGTLAIVTAADDDRVRGVATFSAPAASHTWVQDPGWFLEYARRTGVLRTPDFPPDPAAWIRAIDTLDPLEAATAQSRRGRGCSCTAAPTKWCPSTTPARWPTRPMPTSSCVSCPTARTACATIPAPSPPCSAGWTAKNPDGPAVPVGRRAGQSTASRRAAGFVEDGGEGVVEGVRGFPAGGGAQLGVVADEARAPRPVAEARDRASMRSSRDERGQQSGCDCFDLDRVARAHVVDLAGRAVLDEQAVGRARRRARR